MIKNAQRGITLIETIGALALGSLILVGMTAMIDASVDDAKGQQAALQQEQVANAASRYIAANYADLVTATTAAGGAVAVTLAQLQTAGFLPASFSATNAFRQASCVLVRQDVASRLDSLVATFGGTAIPDRDLPLVAMLAGQGGGYISAAVPGTARGASWELVTTNYRNVACGGTVVLTGAAANDGGHLVSSLFHDGPGQLSQDFLYRNAVPGRPELNQMNEPITMAGDGLVALGAACGANAALAMDGTSRALLVCGTDGLWQSATASSWKAPVATHLALPTTGNTAGDVRMVTDVNRAFTYSGTGWVAIAVDQSGNMSMEGTLTAAQVATSGNVAALGKVSGVGGVEGNWVKGVYWLEGPSLYINAPIAPGTACHIPNGSGGHSLAIGTFSHDGNGQLLACMAPDNVFKYQNGTLTP
ncbi:shufflon system plasmid conjugative transfer pilus tip adhesin PilV [Pseudoduganella namucuonensis]|uniref:Shufflon protein, N-terminal constant region n=1 Tax=Pseudoduganella namucuonensis TaxID=1035707 RepID=A0A1I7L7Y4_9BURK|nr:shufflon system plasmid conjugative transfer pilus tip adhesin PilV [Pseudoduganella namucuonensis]SFV05839.1 shufflon protein, N-terminal constant region [Pseudoduganella namucuonensis]